MRRVTMYLARGRMCASWVGVQIRSTLLDDRLAELRISTYCLHTIWNDRVLGEPSPVILGKYTLPLESVTGFSRIAVAAGWNHFKYEVKSCPMCCCFPQKCGSFALGFAIRGCIIKASYKSDVPHFSETYTKILGNQFFFVCGCRRLNQIYNLSIKCLVVRHWLS